MNQEDQEKLNEQLIKATENSDLPLITFLISKGADIHAKNDYVLRYAASNGYLEIIKYLGEQGADIHTNNDPLYCAAQRGYLKVVKYLVEQDADIYANNDYALRLSSFNGHLEIVQYFLLDCQMQIKQETKDWLIKNHQKEILDLIEKRDLLLKLDKDITQKDSVANLGKKVKI